MYSFPSTSHTRHPRPRWRKIGEAPWTYWLGPLLNVWAMLGSTLLDRAAHSRDLVSVGLRAGPAVAWSNSDLAYPSLLRAVPCAAARSGRAASRATTSSSPANGRSPI